MSNFPVKPRTSDAELTLLIQRSERQGAEILYDTYARYLMLVICRIVPERIIAEQVLADTFKKIWLSIADYDPEKEQFYTWMKVIARNSALERLR